MRFVIHKRRQTPTVIIVALIDVLIVLLIFLMVTTTFKQQPALRLALPESSQALKSGAQEDAPLVVAVDAGGNLWIGPDARPISLEGLKRRLREEASRRPQLKLALSADKLAPFGQIVRVMDAAKEADIRIVNAFTREAATP